MYLKRLVANGFKSFYSRTDIEFAPGINAIVGPNGCGKSNIHDAIQWVLGEQSAKQLRGEEISDVIATGNVRRVSKDSAEAYLTFDDCGDVLDGDSDEVEIGRRVDSDGQGTYFLKGDEVRLKDLKDLFRDTGLGQSLYSSIGQGEVAGLVESRPEELREIIEEAAGIATYRHRRDLSRRRLEQTREELENVEKELREKKGRLSQLKGQAEKARQVRKMKGRLRRCEVERATRKLRRLQDSLSELEQSRREAEADFEDIRRRTRETEERWKSLRDRTEVYETHVRRLESRLDRLQERFQERREKVGRQETRGASLRERIGRASDELERLRKDTLEELEETVDDHQRVHRQVLNDRVLSREQAYLRHRLEELEDRHGSVKQALARRRDLRERLLELAPERNGESAVRSPREGTGELSDLREDLRATRRRLRKCLERRARGARRRRRVAGRIRRLRRRSAFHRDTTRGLRRRATRIRRILHENGDAAPPLEAFKRTSRKLARLHELRTLEGFVGIFDRMVTVPEKHRRAVRAALGPRLYAVLVREREHVPAVADSLADVTPTPAVIQPLSIVPGEREAGRPAVPGGETGAAKPATSLLEAPAELGELVESWLGSMIVTRDLEAARRRSASMREDPSAAPVVTLTGCRLEPDGTLSAYPDGGGAGGRSYAAGSLEAPAGAVTVHRLRFERRRRRTGIRLDTLEDLLEAGRDAARARRERLHALRYRYGRLRRKLHRRLARRAEECRKRFRADLRDRIHGRARGLAADLADRHEDRERHLEQREKHLERRRRRWETRRREVEQRLNALSSTMQESGRTRERNRNRLENLKQRRRSARCQREESRRARHRTERSRVVERLQHERLRVERKTARDLVQDLRTTRDDLRSSAGELNEKLRQRERSLEQARSRSERTEREVANHRARLEDHREYIREELDLQADPKQLRNVDTGEFADMDSDDLDSEERRLRSELRDMQPVNMLADKQAEELSDEVEDTGRQLEDLEASCQELEGIIGRLNRKARDQFLEAFEEIREHFSRLVEELFRGGKGKLSLTDDPVLEAGVRLELKPPGESLKTLSALSGGEKTMTALAFLFALFERKPTPFCFMDEVDAALDDENLHQFIGLLERYSEDTQFLLVTHQKTTMQAASRLFGVTMEESGVTSVIPMSFGEARELREGQPA